MIISPYKYPVHAIYSHPRVHLHLPLQAFMRGYICVVMHVIQTVTELTLLQEADEIFGHFWSTSHQKPLLYDIHVYN